jgi:hypothetical protein
VGIPIIGVDTLYAHPIRYGSQVETPTRGNAMSKSAYKPGDKVLTESAPAPKIPPNATATTYEIWRLDGISNLWVEVGSRRTLDEAKVRAAEYSARTAIVECSRKIVN